MSNLQTRLTERVKAFLKMRKKPFEEADIKEAILSFNDYYWSKVQKVIETKAPKKEASLELSDDERLLIDVGLVHRDLVGASAEDYENMLFEVTLKSFSKNIFYVSEWLQYRWNFDSAMVTLKIENLTHEMSFRKEIPYQFLDDVRKKSFAKLKHIAVSIPGISPQVFETMKTGRLFHYIEDCIFNRVVQGKELMDEEKNLDEFFKKFLLQLQQRCLTQVLKEAWHEFYKAYGDSSEFVKNFAGGTKTEIKDVENEIESQGLLSSDHMIQNTKLLKSLYNLGVAHTGTTRAFSPLFMNATRCTKTHLVRLLNLLSVVDPYLPGPPDILIAPYAGEGFFEWDRNTLIIPISSEGQLERTFISAIVKYRILTDAMNFEGRLKKAWEHSFGKGSFTSDFPKAYSNWVLGVGLGKTNVMSDKKEFKFFLENIGPNPQKGIAPAELVNMDHEQQLSRIKECRAKINAGETDFETVYQMAALNWRRHNNSEAFDYMSKAHQRDPSNQMVKFSMAYLAQQFNREEAKLMYDEIIRNHPKSIWKVFSVMQLATYS